MENTPGPTTRLVADGGSRATARWNMGTQFFVDKGGRALPTFAVRPPELSPPRKFARQWTPDRSHPDGIESATLSALSLSPSSRRRAALDLATVGDSISCHVLNDRRFDRV